MKTLQESLFDKDLASKKTPGMVWVERVQEYLYNKYKLKVDKDYTIEFYRGGDPELIKKDYQAIWNEERDIMIVVKGLKTVQKNLDNIVWYLNDHFNIKFNQHKIHSTITTWQDPKCRELFFINIEKGI